MLPAERQWREVVRRVLSDVGTRLILVEGAAGTGKTHYLRAAVAVAEGAGVPHGGGLLVVDDAHLVSADRLRQLVSGDRVIVLAYRPEELSTPHLPLGVTSYPEGTVLLRHLLQRWTVEDVAAVAAGRVSAERVREVHRLSGGIAQVVVDVLAGRGAVRLAELVIGRTTEAVRPVSWAAAVLDAPARESDVVAVAGLSADEGREALLAALASGLLVEGPEGRYGHVCPLAAEAVRATIPGPLRADLHGRCADVLLRRPDTTPAEVAPHLRAAGRDRAWLRAVERAGHAALVGEGCPERAADLLEDALTTPDVPARTRAELALLLARTTILGLHAEQTAATLRRVLDVPGLPPDVRGQIRLDLGLLVSNQLGSSVGVGELERAAAELAESHPALAARAMSALAIPDRTTDPVQVHLDWLDRAVRAAENGDEVVRVAVEANRSSLLLTCGDPAAWDVLAALPVDHPTPEVRMQATRGLCNAGETMAWLGMPTDADALFTRAVAAAIESGAPYIHHAVASGRLVLDWFSGRWEGLAERCEQVLAVTPKGSMVVGWGRTVLSLLAIPAGRWNTEWEPEEEPVAPNLAPLLAAARIRVAVARGDVEAAAAHARAAWESAAHKAVWPWAAELVPDAASVLARTDGTGQAVVERYAEGVAGLRAPAAHAALWWARAEVAEAAEDWAGAADLFRQAHERYQAIPRPYAAARCLEGAGRCLTRSGGAGRPDLRKALTLYTDLGATWDAARGRADLRATSSDGERARPGRPAHDGLSPREREVAELAGAGLTNREIAETLHLSPRTVEQHVAQARRKLGVLSRRGLAAS